MTRPSVTTRGQQASAVVCVDRDTDARRVKAPHGVHLAQAITKGLDRVPANLRGGQPDGATTPNDRPQHPVAKVEKP